MAISTDKLVIAIEGPCCAGKTTLTGSLIRAAENGMAHVRDYSDFVGGGKYLPDPMPSTEAAEQAALEFFVKIEHARTRDAASHPSQIVIVDRSLHTLIAHCAGIEPLVNYRCAGLALTLLRNANLSFWPHLILYLDIPLDIMTLRNRGKFPTGSLFMDAVYNGGFKNYFKDVRASGVPALEWLDGTLSPNDVQTAARTAIQAFVERSRFGSSVGESPK